MRTEFILNQGDQRKTEKGGGDLKGAFKHGWFWVNEDKEEKPEQRYRETDTVRNSILYHLGFLLKTPLTICTTYFCIIYYPITYFLKQQSASITSQFLRVKDSGTVWLSFSDLRSLKRLQPDGDWAEVNSKDSLT